MSGNKTYYLNIYYNIQTVKRDSTIQWDNMERIWDCIWSLAAAWKSRRGYWSQPKYCTAEQMCR